MNDITKIVFTEKEMYQSHYDALKNIKITKLVKTEKLIQKELVCSRRNKRTNNEGIVALSALFD